MIESTPRLAPEALSSLGMEKLFDTLGYRKGFAKELRSTMLQFYDEYTASGKIIMCSLHDIQETKECALQFLQAGDCAETFWPVNSDGSLDWQQDRGYIVDVVAHLLRRRAISARNTARKIRMRQSAIPQPPSLKATSKSKGKRKLRLEDVRDSKEAANEPVSRSARTRMKPWNEPPVASTMDDHEEYLKGLRPTYSAQISGFTKAWLAEVDTLWPKDDRRLERFMHEHNLYLLAKDGLEDTPSRTHFATGLRQGTELCDIVPREVRKFHNRMYEEVLALTKELIGPPKWVLTQEDDEIVKTESFRAVWQDRETFWKDPDLLEGDFDEYRPPASAKRRKNYNVSAKEPIRSSHATSNTRNRQPQNVQQKDPDEIDAISERQCNSSGCTPGLAYENLPSFKAPVAPMTAQATTLNDDTNLPLMSGHEVTNPEEDVFMDDGVSGECSDVGIDSDFTSNEAQYLEARLNTPRAIKLKAYVEDDRAVLESQPRLTSTSPFMSSSYVFDTDVHSDSHLAQKRFPSMDESDYESGIDEAFLFLNGPTPADVEHDNHPAIAADYSPFKSDHHAETDNQPCPDSDTTPTKACAMESSTPRLFGESKPVHPTQHGTDTSTIAYARKEPVLDGTYRMIPHLSPFSTQPTKLEAMNIAAMKADPERRLIRPITHYQYGVKILELVIRAEDTINVCQTYLFHDIEKLNLVEFFDFYAGVSGVEVSTIRSLTFALAFGKEEGLFIERTGNLRNDEDAWKLTKKMIRRLFKIAQKEDSDSDRFQILV